MAGPGGPRPGSGRPRKREQHAGQIKKAEKRIADHLPELIDLQMELARGVLVEDVNPITGDRVVYKTPPDRAAGQYLINRILGRPTERREITGQDGEALRIVVTYADDSIDPAPPTSGPAGSQEDGEAL